MIRSKTVNIYALITSIISFFIYLKTLCPTVYSGDSGELCTVAYTLSIAHPPGYPLFTLIGWLFGHLPFGSVAFLLNLESALFSTISVYFGFLIFEYLLRDSAVKANHYLYTIIPALGALIWGLSNTLWANSIGAEIYSLSMALVTIIIFLFLRYQKTCSAQLLLLSFYIYGLSLGNHLSVIAIAPILISLLIWPKFNLRNFGAAFLMTIAAISIYLYLPLRSLNYPLMDWSHPANLKAFIEHVTAARFQGFFSQFSVANIILNIKRFFIIIHNEFPLAWLGLLGIFLLAYKKPRLGLPLLLSMLINIGYASMYEIPDIEPHFLITIFLSVAGILFLFHSIFLYLLKYFNRRLASVGFIAAFAAILILEFSTNYRENDQSQNRLAESYANLVLKSLPPNSLLISVGWTSGSPCMYLHNVEKAAPDITVFDPISMESNLAKYLGVTDSLGIIPVHQLAIKAFNKWPGDKFLGKDHLWGGDNPFKYQQYQLQGNGLVYRWGKKNRADLSVWQNLAIPAADTTKQSLNFNDRVMYSNIYLSWGEDLLSNGMIQEAREKFAVAAAFTKNLTNPFISNAMGIFFRRQKMLELARYEYDKALNAPFVSNKVRADIEVNIGNLFRDRNDFESARGHYLQALKFRPGHADAEYNLAVTEAYINLNKKDYKQAVDNFITAMRLDPSDPMLYYNVGLIYDTYLADTANAISYYNEYLRRSGDISASAINLQNRIAKLMTGRQ
jgi:tetratricopeptide (TPR) repeat protein